MQLCAFFSCKKHSWNDSAFADSIEKALVSFGVKVIRDKNELKYKSSLTEFMNSIRESDYIVMIIGDSYLKSENCMYEALEAVKERNFINKVFPIVLESANIYKTEEQLKYITHWNNKKIELENQCKTLPQTSIIPIINNLKKIENITSQINNFMATFKEMIQISTAKIKNEDYQELLEHLKFDLGEMSKILLSSNNEKYSNLKIKGVKDGEISDSFHIYDYLFKFNQNYLENLEILKKFYNNIKNIPIKSGNTNNSAILEEFFFLKKLMAGTNLFEFDDSFFNVGNIGVKNNFIINDSLQITENEKQKYKLLQHFELLFIYIYKFSIYAKRIESYKMVDFILLNNGKSIDEDMEITLYFPKDSIVTQVSQQRIAIKALKTLS